MAPSTTPEPRKDRSNTRSTAAEWWRKFDAWLIPGVILSLLVVVFPTAWRALAGFTALVVLGFTHLFEHRGAPQRALVIGTGALLLLGVMASTATGLVWGGGDYFHQNGQGPLWILYATGLPSSYGPGYFELFSGLIGMAGAPDTALFWAQAGLGSLIPLWTAVIVVGLGGTHRLAWILAAAVAIDPIGLLITHSETYFGTTLSLLMPAGAALSIGFSGVNQTPRKATLGILSAGCLIAQASRVHPVCWVPAALLMTIPMVGSGSWRDRLKRTFLAGAGVGLIVGLLAANVLLEVLNGTLGQHWQGTMGEERQIPLGVALTAALLLAPAIQQSQCRGRALAAGLAVILILVLSGFMNLIGAAANPSIIGAYHRLYLPGLIGCTAVLLQPLRTHTARVFWSVLGSILLIIALLIGLLQSPRPTDALEQNIAREWRADLPENGRVLYFARDGNRIQYLPYFEGHGPAPIRLETTDGSDAILSSALRQGGALFYHRTSLCEMAETTSYCEALETHIRAAGYRLEPIHTLTLPARPSMRDFTYRDGNVEVGIFSLISVPEEP